MSRMLKISNWFRTIVGKPILTETEKGNVKISLWGGYKTLESEVILHKLKETDPTPVHEKHFIWRISDTLALEFLNEFPFESVEERRSILNNKGIRLSRLYKDSDGNEVWKPYEVL